MVNGLDMDGEEEIFPLFDFTLNSFSRRKIAGFLKDPLPSIKAITERQQILRGFDANTGILKDYSYPLLYLNEVHDFLNSEAAFPMEQRNPLYRWFVPDTEIVRYGGKCLQLILFFSHLSENYFSKLDLGVFPQTYQNNIGRMLRFFREFGLPGYKNAIARGRLSHREMAQIAVKINLMRNEGSALRFWDDLFEFEAYLSVSKAIRKHRFCFPVFRNGGIELQDFYHPLLEKPVKNDFTTDNNVTVLNGPNMSGKSTLLKAIGICVYLAHLGFPVPATTGNLPFFDYFCFTFNKKDSLQKGFSHFMSEVIKLKDVLEKASAGKNCFAVFDELYSGTSANDGNELLKNTIVGLNKYAGSYFFISTHMQLKEIKNSQFSVYHLDCKLSGSKPVFTFLIRRGWSDISVGRILFDSVGLNKLLM